MPLTSLVKMRPWKNGLAASLANPVGIVHHGPVAKTGAVARAALVAKGVQIGDPAAAVKVAEDLKDGTKAGPVAAVGDHLKDSPPRSSWRS